MAPVRENRVTATQLTVTALRCHEASQSDASYTHGFETDKQDDLVSEANADRGAGSTYSLSSDGSEYISRLERLGILGSSVWSGMMVRITGSFDDDADRLTAELTQMTHAQPDVQREEKGPLVVTCFSVPSNPSEVRRAIANVDQTFMDDRVFRFFQFDSTVQHRNTAKLPEVQSTIVVDEKEDKDIDIEKASAMSLHPTVGTRGKTLATTIATLVALGVVASLATRMERSTVAACGLSLVLTMGVLAFAMKR